MPMPMLYYARIMTHILILLCSLAMFAQPSDSKAEKEVAAAMNTWRQAMVARDRAALESLYDPGLSYTHSTGKTENKAEAIDAVVNGKDRIESIELSDTSIQVYGTTALVKTKVAMRMISGETANTLNLDVLFVWIKDSSGWHLAARHALRLNQ
jgi:ketosteroid isomerase-like protein